MLIELMKSRRSIRKFEDKPLEQDKIDTILKSALLAPSSRSRRPCSFVAVNDKDVLAKLAACREHGGTFLTETPFAVVVIADTEVSDVWIEDASIASTFIQLTAQDLGLGSCWIQVRERLHSEKETAGAYIKKVLDIPDHFAVECMIAIGYPAEEKESYDETALPYNKLHANQF